MIHTLELLTRLSPLDLQVIKEEFRVTVTVKKFKDTTHKTYNYNYNYRSLHFTYKDCTIVLDNRLNVNKLANTIYHNQLFIVVNPSKILDKKEIVQEDYNNFITEYKKRFFEVFQFTEPIETLNRIDYKIDVITEYKDILIKLMKKTTLEHKRLSKKGEKQFDTSLFLKSEYFNYNLYDKEAERIAKGQDITGYENMLRFEIQVKRKHIEYNYKNHGVVRNIESYFNKIDMEYYINTKLKDIIYKGDYYNLYHSTKILEVNCSKNMTTKLIKLLKQISLAGVVVASLNYNKNTFNSYLKKLQDVGINPIIIPKNEKFDDKSLTKIPNIFNFSNSNVYLLEDYKLKVS